MIDFRMDGCTNRLQLGMQIPIDFKGDPLRHDCQLIREVGRPLDGDHTGKPNAQHDHGQEENLHIAENQLALQTPRNPFPDSIG
ncbi:MAG: hypothetical protein IPI28_13775 [Candidatus Omnitrophica bacterium]|nr:hypothetical protein [Candidatus Omnitrophota bacterium]